LNFRFVLFASKSMVPAHSVADVPLISMPCAHQGPVTEWRLSWLFSLTKQFGD
jgi:hypothetical protein